MKYRLIPGSERLLAVPDVVGGLSEVQALAVAQNMRFLSKDLTLADIEKVVPFAIVFHPDDDGVLLAGPGRFWGRKECLSTRRDPKLDDEIIARVFEADRIAQERVHRASVESTRQAGRPIEPAVSAAAKPAARTEVRGWLARFLRI